MIEFCSKISTPNTKMIQSVAGHPSILKFFGFSILLLLAGCADQPADREIGSDPLIHWFTYEGNDPVFQEFEVGEGEYQNPVIAGFYPDPSVVRTGEDYYMVNSTFSWFPGIPLFHSRDLVNWTQIGHVLDRPSQLDIDDLEMSEGVFAPTINYHNGTYYVLSTVVAGGGNFMVTAEDPAGEWSDPIWLPDVQGIDPSILFDDDGTIYILNNGPAEGEPLYEGHRALWIQEYDPETQTTGPDQVIVDGGVDITQEPIWIEAPHLMKIGDEYILSAAEGGTGPGHSQVVFKADHPLGPYEPWDQNPILTQRHLDPKRPFPVGYTGHADMVETQNGEWWAVFLGVRPYEGDYFNTGRETFLLPVEWTEDGWPVILEGDDPVAFVHQKPDLPEQPVPEIPTTGNFSFTDHFDGDQLADYWSFIRTPKEKWYTLEDGKLHIEARPVGLSDFGRPSFIGRRQQHAFATASIRMQYRPEQPGDAAGLAVFQNDNYYYFIGVTLGENDDPQIQLEKREDGVTEILASERLNADRSGDLFLRIDARGSEYDFLFSTEEGEWNTLYENADGTILSTEVAGGFVGAFFGMIAYTEHI